MEVNGKISMNSAEVHDFSFGFFVWSVFYFHWEGHLGSVALGQTSAVFIYIHLLGVDFNDGGILYPKIIWRSVLHLIEITMHYLIICIYLRMKMNFAILCD